MNKYRARRVELDGYLFDSQAEARRYGELLLLERAGEIADLELQPEFVLLEDFEHEGRRVRGIRYRADFRYLDKTGRVIVEDVKGHRTKEFLLKWKILLFRYGRVASFVQIQR